MRMDGQMDKLSLAIVAPVFNDWPSLHKLIRTIAEQEKLKNSRIRIIAVDDGSPIYDPPKGDMIRDPVEAISIVRLKANQGHQRAIALGLAYLFRNHQPDLVVIMDSDGEDRPENIAELIAAHQQNPGSIVVAQRRRRSEGLFFRAFYKLYKLAFVQLTGRHISFGNFSLIPINRLPNVIYNDAIWNSYPAALLRCHIPLSFVDADRGARYFGVSSMNFTSLMLHGMSAIAAFSDIVIGRIIAALALSVILFTIAVAVIIFLKLSAGFFLPGYATTLILFLSNMLISALLIGFLLILTLLASRTQRSTTPSTVLDDLLLKVDNIDRSKAAA